jgi:hypothetical protein
MFSAGEEGGRGRREGMSGVELVTADFKRKYSSSIGRSDGISYYIQTENIKHFN